MSFWWKTCLLVIFCKEERVHRLGAGWPCKMNCPCWQMPAAKVFCDTWHFQRNHPDVSPLHWLNVPLQWWFRNARSSEPPLRCWMLSLLLLRTPAEAYSSPCCGHLKSEAVNPRRVIRRFNSQPSYLNQILITTRLPCFCLDRAWLHSTWVCWPVFVSACHPVDWASSLHLTFLGRCFFPIPPQTPALASSPREQALSCELKTCY